MQTAVAHKPEQKKNAAVAPAPQPLDAVANAKEEPAAEGMPLYLQRTAISASASAEDDPGAVGHAKLVVGPTDDAYEREADRLAAAAVSGSPPSSFGKRPAAMPRGTEPLQRACACGGTCPRCRGEETVGPIQRRPAVSGGTAASAPLARLPRAHAGHPLSPSVRSRVEPLVGADLGHVRVHSDPAARATAARLHARAFTHQDQIWLGAHESAEDVGLMAHEATHVVQQGHGGASVIQRAPESPDVLGGAVAFGKGLVSSAVGYGREAAGAVREGIGTAVEAGREVILATIEEYAPGALQFFRNLRGYLAERVSAGFDGLFGGLAGRIRREGIAGAMQSVLGELAGGALKGVGGLIAGACSAMGEAANLLLDLGAKLGGEAIEAIRDGAAAVGAFFEELWAKYGAPAADALRSFAGAVWEGIKEQVGEWWEKLAPLRDAAREVWEWFVGVYAEGKSAFESFLETLFEMAVEKWEEIKQEILPFMGYAKALGVVLLLLSPMGPFVVAGAAAYGLYELFSYVWENWGRPLTAEIRTKLAEEVLPAILSGVETLRNAIDAARAWLSNLADELVAQAVGLLDAIGAIPYLQMAQQLITELSERLQEFANTVKATIDELAAAIGQFLESAWQFFQPILEFVRQTLLVAALGPFAILDDGVWNTVNKIAQLALSVPCLRELAAFLQLPEILAQGERFRKFMKDAWTLIQNPDPIIQAIHDALAPMVEAVPGIAASVVAQAIYPDEEEHRLGVQRHLEPAIAQLQSDWWEELKKMGWTLIWPWDEVSERLSLLIQHGSEAIGAVFDLEIGLAIDKFFAMMQDLNTILGALWGWFAIAAMLIGGVLGALGVEFSGGATIGAGVAAGWALAETVGLVLIAALAATELGIIGKSMFDIRFVNRTIDDGEQRANANDEDYKSIANSTFTLAVVTALVILGAIAQKIASAIWSKIRPPRGPRPGEPGATGEPGRRGGRSADSDSTARPGDFTPEEIRAARDGARQRARNPENVREVTDPELARKYDAEIDLGDGRTMRRNRETGQWCLFRNPRICGIEMESDINAAADRASGAGTDITDQVRSGSRSKPAGEGWTHSPNWEKWIERGGTIREHPDGSVTLTAKDGTTMRYSPQGDPNFAPFLDDPWGIRQVELEGGFDPQGRRPLDFKRANQQVGHPEWGSESPPDYTWHHTRDGKTMQLVPRRIHRMFRHSGGVADLPK